MQKLAKYTIYDVDRLGLYHVRGKAFYDDFSEIFTDLADMVADSKNIYETVMFEPKPESDDSNIYCYDVAKSNNLLFVLWNDVPSIDGQTLAIDGSKKPGQGDVKKSNYPEGYLPGFPKYFWILPENKQILSVHFDFNRPGTKDFKKYVKGFLTKFSRKAEIIEADDGSKNIFYRDDKGKRHCIFPQFELGRAKRKSQLEQIRTNRSRIQTIIQQETLTFNKKTDEDFLLSVLKKLGIATVTNFTQTPVRYKNAINVCPNKEELDTIIENWQSGDAPEKIGFKLQGSDETFWLDSYLLKGEIQLDIEWNEFGVIPAKSLLAALDKHQTTILSQHAIQ